MMFFESFKEMVRAYRLKKQYPTARLHTTMIHRSANLGTNVYLANNCDIRANVAIGDFSYCSKGTTVFQGTKIGKYCSIGYNVQIGCPEHPLHWFSTSPSIYRSKELAKYCEWPEDDIDKPVVIGNDVWIGSNAVILQGVSIGNGSVIAAGSVVTKNTDEFCIWGGVPAKKIGERFSDDIKNLISESNWWDHDIDWIKEFYEASLLKADFNQ